MKFLSRLFEPRIERRGVTLGDLLQESQSSGSISVTPDTAMRCSTVYACVRVLTESVASCPCILYERRGDQRMRAVNHPLYTLLHDAPNENQTAFEFFEGIMVALNLRGNAYAYINRVNGVIQELLPIHPDLVTPQKSTAGIVTYEVRSDMGSPKTYRAEQILHVRALSLDGLIGMSPIMQQREAIGLAMHAQDHGSKMMQNGAKPAGVISVQGKLSDSARMRLRDSWQSGFTGENRYRTALLEEGMTWAPMTMTAEDAQYLETRKFQRSEICSIFRVPPHKIGDLERATFSNIEHQSLEFTTDSLLSWFRRIEQSIKRSLLQEDGPNYYTEFMADVFLRGDTQSRMNSYAVAISNGIMNRNEARARENLNPYPGGDEFLMPLNMTTSTATTAAGGKTDDAKD